jgi:hypothetical protein
MVAFKHGALGEEATNQASDLVLVPMWEVARERELFIGTQFSNLYAVVDTTARGEDT